MMTARLVVLCVMGMTGATLAGDPMAAPQQRDAARVVGKYVRVAVRPIEVRGDGALALRLEIRPDEGIHLFAPGQTGFLAPTLTPTAEAGIQAWRTVGIDLPPGEPFVINGTGERVRVYQSPFTLVQFIKMAEGQRSGQPPQHLEATLRYQACSDTVCYKPETLRLSFTRSR